MSKELLSYTNLDVIELNNIYLMKQHRYFILIALAHIFILNFKAA